MGYSYTETLWTVEERFGISLEGDEVGQLRTAGDLYWLATPPAYTGRAQMPNPPGLAPGDG